MNKLDSIHRHLFAISGALGMLMWVPSALADTTITYQGQLKQSGQPFSGTPGMSFRLYDSLSGGDQIGVIEFFSGVPVTEGLFQVELDFGAGAFGGGERFLEIEVSGTTLSPRQKITGAPGVVAGAVGSVEVDPSQVQLRITGTCEPGTTLAGINPDGSVVCDVLPIGVAYLADGIGVVGTSTSIALGNDGNAIISYFDETNVTLKLYDCANAVCSSGTTRTLDNDGNVGTNTAIAIRANGNPIISYLDITNFSLKAYDCSEPACASGIARTLDSNGNVGQFSSIAIRADGLPIISYYDNTNGNLNIFDCANTACSTGTIRILDNNGDVGRNTSIAVRSNGHPIISYIDASNLNLKVYDCANANCSTGTSHTLDDDKFIGAGTAIAVRVGDRAIIAYLDIANANLMAYDCANASCSSGTIRVLDSTGRIGTITALFRQFQR